MTKTPIDRLAEAMAKWSCGYAVTYDQAKKMLEDVFNPPDKLGPDVQVTEEMFKAGFNAVDQLSNSSRDGLSSVNYGVIAGTVYRAMRPLEPNPALTDKRKGRRRSTDK